jgi:nitrous oxidase accessory protein
VVVRQRKRKCPAVVLFGVLFVLVLAASGTIAFLPVNAESRTIVVPDDYPTIAFAVGNATDGDTIFVRNGTYEEHTLVITKSVTLIGEDKDTTVIENIDTYDETASFLSIFLPVLVAVEIRADNVRFWNFKVTSAHRFLPVNVSADVVQVVNNIFEPASKGVIVDGNNSIIAGNMLADMINGGLRCTGANNTITENKLIGDSDSNYGAIYVNGLHNLVYNNEISETSRSGVGMLKMRGDENIVARNNLTNRAGIELLSGSNNIVCGNKILHGVSISVAYGSSNIFYANQIESCGVGASIRGSASNTVFYHNNFENNTSKVWMDNYVSDGHHFDNGKEGNYWSDYPGEDNDGDGIGDSPYLICYNHKDNHPLMAPFNVDSVTFELPKYETPSFELPHSMPLSTVVVVAASIAVVASVGAGVIVFFKKRKR